MTYNTVSYTAKFQVLDLTPKALCEVHTKWMLILTLVGVSLILHGVKFNIGLCESINLTPTGVEIYSNLAWTSHNTRDVKCNTRVFAVWN